MKNILSVLKINFSVLLPLCLLLASCGSIKKYKYFQDISDTTKLSKLNGTFYKEPLIQNDDILYIAVQTLDPTAATAINSMNFLNTPNFSSLNANNVSALAVTGNQASVYGYLVDKNGQVHIPVLGDVKLSGLTTTQARELLTAKATNFYKDATVILRFANFKITVIGEVSRPGTFTIPTEKVSLLDALGYAGDLTIYGRRDNVLLMRKNNDGIVSNYRIDLTNTDFMKSPAFYLQQNDLIYVQPLQTKVNNSDATQARNISIISGLISVLIVYLTRLR